MTRSSRTSARSGEGARVSDPQAGGRRAGSATRSLRSDPGRAPATRRAAPADVCAAMTRRARAISSRAVGSAIDCVRGIVGVLPHLVRAQIRRIGNDDGEVLPRVERSFRGGAPNVRLDRESLGIVRSPRAGVRAVVDLHDPAPTEVRGREPDVPGAAVELEERSGRRRRGELRRPRALLHRPCPRCEDPIVVFHDDRAELDTREVGLRVPEGMLLGTRMSRAANHVSLRVPAGDSLGDARRRFTDRARGALHSRPDRLSDLDVDLTRGTGATCSARCCRARPAHCPARDAARARSGSSTTRMSRG